jgi:hypothetical protein
LAAIRQADATRKIAPPARAATGMVITARRGKPDAQSASLSYATSAGPEGARVGAGATATLAVADASDDWLRRARELEAAGKRKEALQAYRQAAASLRADGSRPHPSRPLGRPAAPDQSHRPEPSVSSLRTRHRKHLTSKVKLITISVIRLRKKKSHFPRSSHE